jgi:hypothetical protein
MDVRFSQLESDLGGFSSMLYRWSQQGRGAMRIAFRQVGERFKAEAKKRVPVDEGRLRNAILSNTYEDSLGELVTEVGSNVDYAVYVEFGTKWIAHGAVKAIGITAEVTDAEAVHWWQAKARDAVGMDAVSIGWRGGRLVGAGGFGVGGPQEQMPWLRAAWSAIKPWAIETIGRSMRPPANRN